MAGGSVCHLDVPSVSVIEPIYNHSDLRNVAFYVAIVLDRRCGDRYGDNNANYVFSEVSQNTVDL